VEYYIPEIVRVLNESMVITVLLFLCCFVVQAYGADIPARDCAVAD